MRSRLCIALCALILGPGSSCQIPSRKKAAQPAARQAADVVVIQLHGAITETGDDAVLFGTPSRALRKLLRILRQARLSKKVDKIVLRIGRLSTGWAQLDELRQAVLLCRKAGKRVVAHLDDAGNGEYYLATAADEIVMSATGSLWLTGVAARVTFVKGLLDKVGIQAELMHQGKYKGAADALTRKTMSPAMKEALGAVLDSAYRTLVATVSKTRKIDGRQVERLIDQAPHPAEALKALKLIDRVAEHRADTRRLAGRGSINWKFGLRKKPRGTLRSLMELLRPKALTRPPKLPHVALVYAEGQIVYGPERKGLAVGPHVASHHLSRVLDELRENNRVRAVVLRINSPGGSALASDLIWHAVKRLASAKPTVVSMGDVAASGGYYIASPATRILAQPYTLTGSIGVVGGKFSLAGLFEKIGVTSETLHRGARADLFNLARAWTPGERQVIQALMARTYRQFVSRVATGRKLSVAKVQQAAQGRIWSGTDAKKQRLVDQLGGLLDAVAEAKRLGKLPRDAKTAVYPRPKTWLEKLQEGLGGDQARVRLLHSLLALGPVEMRLLGDLVTLLRQWQREVVLTWMPVLVTVR